MLAHAAVLGRPASIGVTIDVEFGWSWRVREVDGHLAAVVSIDSARMLAKRWRWERADTCTRIEMSSAMLDEHPILLPVGGLLDPSNAVKVRQERRRALLGIFTWGPAMEPPLGEDVELLREWVAEQARQLGEAAQAVLATSVASNLDLDSADARRLCTEMAPELFDGDQKLVKVREDGQS